MAVRIRMKKLGRRHRSYFRICAIDQRTPRDGRVLEELGTYDPHVPDADARARINAPRAEYWLSVGAQPSEKVRVLLKKYGPGGTHLEKQKVALAQLAEPRVVPDPGLPASRPKPVSAVEAAQNKPKEMAVEEKTTTTHDEASAEARQEPAGDETLEP